MYSPGQSITVTFNTYASSGELRGDDATPSAVLLLNGADSGVTVTISAITTGKYKATFTLPAGAGAGAVYELELGATVGGVANRWVEARFPIAPGPTTFS